MTDDKAKHRAIILIKFEVHEIIPKTNENSAKLVTKEELDRYGLKPTCVIEVEGFNKQDCLTKLRERLYGPK